MRLVEFIETTIFTAVITDLVSDEEYAAFQHDLARNPERGDLMRGCGGVRKIRMAARGKGKSGGARIIYYYLKNHETIYLLYTFSKGDADNLSAAGKKMMREWTQQIQDAHHE